MLDSPFKCCGEAVEAGGVWTLGPEASVREAARVMRESRQGCVPIVDGAAQRLVGVISESDLVSKIMATGLDPDVEVVGAFMTCDPHTVEHDQPIEEALNVMNDYGCRHVPVMIGKSVMGVISAKSILAMA